MLNLILFLCTISAVLAASHIEVGPLGPKFPPTKGEVWPKPKLEKKEICFYSFSPSEFKFKVMKEKCEILTNAIRRYTEVLTELHTLTLKTEKEQIWFLGKPLGLDQSRMARHHRHRKVRVGKLELLKIHLDKPCEDYPSFDMDERYNLTVSSSSTLISDSIWGILRGLETFSQLFYLSNDYSEVYINGTYICDEPAYKHRGLLLDTSRHYISVDEIKVTLDAMEMNKMNVFHWHIVDDQSFPYQSETFPEFSAIGAYHHTMVYTLSDIESLMDYARDRGIRVIPEFDVPGHTRSWGVAHPEILTQCYDTNGKPNGLGPMQPLMKKTYKIIRDLYKEVQHLFIDQYFHIGGDEVDMDCWASNPFIKKYIERNNITSMSEIHNMFIKKVLKLIRKKFIPIVWQEVFDNGIRLPTGSIVQVWKWEWIKEMHKILQGNNRLILSSPYYLDHLSDSFSALYTLGPRCMVENAFPDVLQFVVGGEACMWGEMVDESNIISRTWPRASAVAEVLWTEGPCSRNETVPRDAYHRIEEHACRMRRRGVAAEPPNGPGFCVY